MASSNRLLLFRPKAWIFFFQILFSEKVATPAVAREPHHPAKKFSSHFLICARRFFSSNLRLYFAKQNAPPREVLPLAHPTHSRATLSNSLKIHLQNCLN